MVNLWSFRMDLKDRVQSFVGHLLDIDDWKEWYMDIETIILHPSYDEQGNMIQFHSFQYFYIQLRITLRSMRSQCYGKRKSFTVQLNSRPVWRIELYTKVCTVSFLILRGC